MTLSRFLLKFTTINAFSRLKPECAEIGKAFQPKDCCKYPLSFLPMNVAKECDEKCKLRTADPMNCLVACVDEKHPLYANGKIIWNNTFEYFHHDMEYRNISRAVWQPVFDSSIAACEKLGEDHFYEHCKQI